MRLRKKLSKLSIFIPCLLLIGGCWDQKEVEELAFVVAIGIDKAQENENMVKITYLISNPEAGSAAESSSSQEPAREIITFEAADFISSRNLSNTVIAKQITYDLLSMIFVSEDFARDEKFIRWIYDATKSMEIRRDITLITTKEDTSTFMLNNKPLLETRPHEYFEKILATGDELGLSPPSELNSFFRITEADADLFLSKYATTEVEKNRQSREDQDDITAGQFYFNGETNNTQFVGSAVYKEGKMIDTLTIEETRMTYLLNPTLEPGFFLATFKDPMDENYSIVSRIEADGPLKLKMNLKSDTPNIKVTVPLLFEVLSNHSMTDYTRDVEKRQQLKSNLKQNMEKKFEEYIKKTQEEYKANPFGWSLSARKQFNTISAWENFDWMKSYPDIKVEVNVQPRLGKFGRQSNLPSLEEVKD